MVDSLLHRSLHSGPDTYTEPPLIWESLRALGWLLHSPTARLVPSIWHHSHVFPGGISSRQACLGTETLFCTVPEHRRCSTTAPKHRHCSVSATEHKHCSCTVPKRRHCFISATEHKHCSCTAPEHRRYCCC